MISHPDVEQGSEEWFGLRKGRPTASRFKDIITAARGDLSKSARKYMVELIGECYNDAQEFGGNHATDRGTALEPEAREAFEAETGLKVDCVGFCTRDDEIVGCSPDGLVRSALSDDHAAGLEIKCPYPKTHVGYILDGGLPDAYKQQVHGSMAVTGLDRWHFWSYCPGMASFHLEVERDDYTAQVESALDGFLVDYAAFSAEVRPLLAPKKPATGSMFAEEEEGLI